MIRVQKQMTDPVQVSEVESRALKHGLSVVLLFIIMICLHYAEQKYEKLNDQVANIHVPWGLFSLFSILPTITHLTCFIPMYKGYIIKGSLGKLFDTKNLKGSY